MNKPLLGHLVAKTINHQQQRRDQLKTDVLSLIKSCSKHTHLLQIHSHIVSSNLISDSAVCFAFLSRSLALRGLTYSRKVFDQIARPFNAHYNVIIRACSSTESSAIQGLKLYRDMRRRGVSPNEFSSSFAVKCCLAGAPSLIGEVGIQIHARVVTDGHGWDSHVLTSLTEMYSRSDRFYDARNMFDEIPQRDTVAWNVLISCYLRNDRAREALGLFEAFWTGGWGCKPDEVSCLLAIQACSDTNALEHGINIHRYVERRGFGTRTNLKNSLVSMYSRCGHVEKARAVFEEIMIKDVVSWTAMIAGYAANGLGDEAVKAFREMESSGVYPNEHTFSAVLSACSRTGMVEEGTAFFNQMVTEFRVSRSLRHYGCMVDLLGRAGHLDEAHRLIKSMDIDPDPNMWRTLLGACRVHGRVDLAQLAIAELVKAQAHEASDYVLMSYIHSSAGEWDKVKEARRLVIENPTPTTRGRSTIELNGVVHEFLAADTSHPLKHRIYKNLGKIVHHLKIYGGYVVDVSSELHRLGLVEDKERSVLYHSEKLAISLGVLSTPCKATIRVAKNLRTCMDCHNFAKVFSRVYDREVVFRDRNRIHHFRQGRCSCNDYW